MDNPFYPKPHPADIFGLLNSSTPSSPFSSPLALTSALPVTGLLQSYSPPAPPVVQLPIKPRVNVLAAPEVKRKVYFAFDFDDLIRVNNVRQIGKIVPREQKNPRTFMDRSLWDSRNIKNQENLKNLMRNAIRFSSAVCVLVGTNTWKSRWVKYEIARAVIEERGLLAVQINSINHHQRRLPDRLGVSPLHVLGIYHDPNDRYYLYEQHIVVREATKDELGFEWRPYEDYTDPVPLPRYIQNLNVGFVIPLSSVTYEYDMVAGGGFNNLGAWVDAAAARAGR